MHPIVITATGLFTPPNAVTNAELVEAFNSFIAKANSDRPAGEEPLQPSSEAFIVKASGVRARYMMDKAGVAKRASLASSGSPAARQNPCHSESEMVPQVR